MHTFVQFMNMLMYIYNYLQIQISENKIHIIYRSGLQSSLSSQNVHNKIHTQFGPVYIPSRLQNLTHMIIAIV